MRKKSLPKKSNPPCWRIVQIITCQAAIFLLANATFAQDVIKQLEKYSASHHLEKIYITHDKPYYFPGDTLWGKVFLVDGITHQVFDAEPIVYVDWIDPNGNLLTTLNIKIDQGTAVLDIPIKLDDTVGNYTIRAHTLYQRNFDPAYFFQKEINVLDVKSLEKEINDSLNIENYNIQFFPEGGNLVAGLKCNLFFLAKNKSGQPIHIEGKLMDGASEVASIKTLFNGMGKVTFTPVVGKKYIVKAKHGAIEKQVSLEQVLPEGYNLAVKTTRDSFIDLTVTSSIAKALNNARIIGHTRSQVFLDYTIDDGNNLSLALRKTELYNGVLHFTLFDPTGKPSAERLVFNYNPKDKVDVDINLDHKEVQKRSLVSGDVQIKQYNNQAIANASMTVYLTDLVPEATSSADIFNYILLQSDIPSKIPNIGSYFQKDSKNNRTHLDMLLATYGWRRFNWDRVIQENPMDLLYPTEEHFSIIGTAKKAGRDKTIQSDISLFILDEDEFTSVGMTTDESGLFSFTGFDFKDTTEILIQSNVYNERRSEKQNKDEILRRGNKEIDLELIRLNDMPLLDSLSIRGHKSLLYSDEKTKKASINQIRAIDNGASDIWTIDLDEVVVKSRINKGTEREIIAKKRYKDLGLFYRASTQKFLVDEQFDKFKFENIFELIKHVAPGAKLIRENGQPAIIYGRFSSGNKALIALDGRVVLPDFLLTIDPKHIELVDIMKGENPYDDKAARIIQKASGPLIMLVSKDPSKIKIPNPGVINFAHPGYYKARTFYSPVHSTTAQTTDPDIRTTLHWDPWIDSSNGAVAFEFYTGDLSGNFLIKIEGITDYGIPFSHSQLLRVN